MNENAGMLFFSDYPHDIQMWMKDTLIPLDMIFFDEKGKIVHIHPNAVPNDLTVISSGMDVMGVIELNGGRTEQLNIKVGDVIHFE